MGNPETQELSDVQGPMERIGESFRRVREIMREPYTEDEIESLMWQTPIELPNDISQLPAEEEPTENENQLHLQLP